ncbi:DUF202 domain-containing protein [Rhodococcus sp. X156]|uniref:DUF202 domain-containing protein n=1 Tax=Rhodococcus sp. X156 TaxID=2499145 RepID=UPI0019D0AA85|nr:DUF202 domain-containing protein [Rhodococcus sp. X156]
MRAPGGGQGVAERTQLAWSRTSLAVLVNGALLLLRYPQEGEVGRADIALAALSVVIAALTVCFGRVRSRQIAAHRDDPPGPRTVVILALSGAIALYAAAIVANLLLR